MAIVIVLSECRMHVWKTDSPINLADLKICFEVDSDQIVVKQSSEFCSPNSSVAYELKPSNCSYLDSYSLSPASKVISFRLSEDVSTIAHTDESIDPQNMADEIATLRIFFPDTPLPKGCQLDIFVSDDFLQNDCISQLLKRFGDDAKKELARQIQPQTISKDKSRTSSINASSDDLDRLEALLISSNTMINHLTTGQKHKSISHESAPWRSRATETIDLAKAAESEEFLLRKRKESRALWKQINKPGGQQDISKPRSTASEPKMDPKTEWARFAASHGPSQVVRRTYATSAIDTPTGYTAPSSGTSRGDSVRFEYGRYSRFSFQYHTRGGHRGNRSRALASFIPPTNRDYASDEDEEEE